MNLLNPKAYAAFLAIFAQFLLPFNDTFLGLAITGGVCFVVGLFVDIVWLSMEGLLKTLFEQEKPARRIRVTFAILMVVAVAITLVNR